MAVREQLARRRAPVQGRRGPQPPPGPGSKGTPLAGCRGSAPADMESGSVRGYFAIGVEGISKPMNVGALLRTAHAFGAGFVFAIAPAADLSAFGPSDTSAAAHALPFYVYPDAAALVLPAECRLVGVELMAEAVELPSFRH